MELNEWLVLIFTGVAAVSGVATWRLAHRQDRRHPVGALDVEIFGTVDITGSGTDDGTYQAARISNAGDAPLHLSGLLNFHHCRLHQIEDYRLPGILPQNQEAVILIADYEPSMSYVTHSLHSPRADGAWIMWYSLERSSDLADVLVRQWRCWKKVHAAARWRRKLALAGLHVGPSGAPEAFLPKNRQGEIQGLPVALGEEPPPVGRPWWRRVLLVGLQVPSDSASGTLPGDDTPESP